MKSRRTLVLGAGSAAAEHVTARKVSASINQILLALKLKECSADLRPIGTHFGNQSGSSRHQCYRCESAEAGAPRLGSVRSHCFPQLGSAF